MFVSDKCLVILNTINLLLSHEINKITQIILASNKHTKLLSVKKLLSPCPNLLHLNWWFINTTIIWCQRILRQIRHKFLVNNKNRKQEVVSQIVIYFISIWKRLIVSTKTCDFHNRKVVHCLIKKTFVMFFCFSCFHKKLISCSKAKSYYIIFIEKNKIFLLKSVTSVKMIAELHSNTIGKNFKDFSDSLN